MSKKVLVFGNLYDIITTKEVEIMSLRREIIDVEEEFLDDDLCVIHCKQHHCNGCPVEKVCDIEVKLLQEEINKIEKEIELLKKEKHYVESRSLP